MAIAIVGGAIANKPRNGGEAWVRMSWILGLRRLGFDVYFAEVLDRSVCVEESGRWTPFERSVNRAHLERVVEDIGLEERVALLDETEGCLYGLDARALADVLAEADVLFDLSGHLGERGTHAGTTLRVYVDLDPGFTQVWHTDPSLGFTLSSYDRYVTVGLNVGEAACMVPTGGLEWTATPPPVVLERWPCEAPTAGPVRFTSVARWRGPYGPIELDGQTLGLKHHEFRRLIDLPKQVEDVRFELALDIDPTDARDRRELHSNGWDIVDPAEVAATPTAFRDYVRGSHAEFSVAQPVYVATRSGWFSDRTAAYLAAGRPAVVQDTGIVSLPRGEGLVTFSSPREAAEGVRRVAEDPEAHAEAARALAERYLDSDRVLGSLLEVLGIGG